MENKHDKCIECNKKAKPLFRVRTCFGLIPVCRKCFGKVFKVKAAK